MSNLDYFNFPYRPATMAGLIPDEHLMEDDFRHLENQWTAARARRGWRLNGVSDTTLVSGTLLWLTWNSKLTDTDGFITLSNQFVTIPAGLGGLYAMGAVVTVTTSWTYAGDFCAYDVGGATRASPAIASTGTLTCFVTQAISDGTTIRFGCDQLSGSNKTLSSVEWWGWRLGS